MTWGPGAKMLEGRERHPFHTAGNCSVGTLEADELKGKGLPLLKARGAGM